MSFSVAGPYFDVIIQSLSEGKGIEGANVRYVGLGHVQDKDDYIDYLLEAIDANKTDNIVDFFEWLEEKYKV